MNIVSKRRRSNNWENIVWRTCIKSFCKRKWGTHPLMLNLVHNKHLNSWHGSPARQIALIWFFEMLVIQPRAFHLMYNNLCMASSDCSSNVGIDTLIKYYCIFMFMVGKIFCPWIATFYSTLYQTCRHVLLTPLGLKDLYIYILR